MPMPGAFSRKEGAKGRISGIVIDCRGRAVTGAKVQGIWTQRWTILFPPPGFTIVSTTTTTDANGRFSFITRDRIDILDATRGDLEGRLNAVTQSGNTIRVKRDYWGTADKRSP